MAHPDTTPATAVPGSHSALSSSPQHFPTCKQTEREGKQTNRIRHLYRMSPSKSTSGLLPGTPLRCRTDLLAPGLFHCSSLPSHVAGRKLDEGP